MAPSNSDQTWRTTWTLVAGGCLVWCLLWFVLPAPSQATFLRTLALGLSASLVAVPLASISVWVCTRSGWFARGLLLVIVTLALLPLVIHVSSWDAAFGKLGWLTELSGQALMPLVSGWLAASWIHGLAAAPQLALLLLIYVYNDQRIHEEQALLETSAWQVFWRITVWRYIPVGLIGILWVISVCAREIAVSDLYQIETIAEQVYLGYSLNNNTLIGSWSTDQLTSAAQLSQSLVFASLIVQTLFCLGVVVAVSKVTSVDTETTRWKSQPCEFRHLAFGALLLLVMACAPLMNTIARASFHIQSIDGVASRGFDLSRIPAAVTRATQDYADEMTWSFLIATVSATLIVISSLLLVFWAGRVRWRQAIFAFLLALGFAIPGPVLGSALVWLFSLPSGEFFYWLTDYTIFGPVVAATLFCWPVCGLMIWSLTRRVSANVIENAQLEGAGGLTQFWEFGIKANWIAILGIWLVGFTLAFGELAASSMVRPAGMDTVPRKMLGDLHAGVDELTAGITIVIIAFVFVIAWITAKLFQLNSRARSRK